MARLKGGSHVAGALTVEGMLTTGGIQLDVDKTLIFSANANLTQNKVAKSSTNNEIIDSNIIDTGSLITLGTGALIQGSLEVTGNLQAASIYLEEDGNSSNQLRLLNNSGLSADRTLTFNVSNANRTLTLSNNVLLNQNVATSSNVTFNSITSLTTKLSIANGGTGVSTSPVPGGIIYGVSSIAQGTTLAGTAGQFLKSNGAGKPYWQTLVIPDPDVVITQQTTTVTVAAGGLSDTITAATASVAGIVTTGTQTIAGVKTFNNTTASSSTITGAVKISGGLGVAKDIWGLKVHNAVYNDLAEFMYFAEQSEPGEVVAMTDKGVKRSWKRGLKTVVGVHSDTFGYSLGESEAKKKTPIGLSGRVNVKISEKCKIGDILISGKCGMASVRRWYDFWRTGCNLGKVLENKTTTKLERISMLILN